MTQIKKLKSTKLLSIFVLTLAITMTGLSQAEKSDERDVAKDAQE